MVELALALLTLSREGPAAVVRRALLAAEPDSSPTPAAEKRAKKMA